MRAIEQQGRELLDQYKTRLWMSDGKIIYLINGVTKSAKPKERHSLGDMVIHAAADPVAKPDGEHLTRFMNALHEQAARAVGDAERPGYLQLSYLVPDGKMISTRHKIGAVDECVQMAVSYADSGNVYVEGRTIKPETARGIRGDAADTEWVFAFVIDADADKAKGFDLGEIQPTMTVESSPGNHHFWFFLEKAIAAEQAKPIGDAIRKATGTDSGTGNICQPFRVGGTPNLPDKKKRERGRVLCATRLVDYRADVLWTPEKLLAAFAAPQKEQPKQRKTQGKAEPGTLPAYLLREVKTDVPEGERSQRFMGVVSKLKRFMLPFHKEATLDKIVELFEQNPDGIASKYAADNRIRGETERVYSKVAVHLGTLPVIVIQDGEIPRMLGESADALKKAGVPLYARGGIVVQPHKEVYDAADGRRTGATVLTKVTIPGITVEMAHAATFVEYKLVDGIPTPVYANPPANIANIMLAPNRFFTVPTVSGIITTPLIREDGSIFGGDREAYDPRSAMYYVPSITMPTLSERPSQGEAKQALDFLKSLLSEFKFVGPVDQSVALAAMLTALTRGSMPAAPMFLMRAHTAGTGKSYLVDLCSTLATGEICPVIADPKNDEELEKRLGAMLLSGVPIISLDNLSRDIGGDLLCQITERPRVRTRILGKSETPEFDCRVTVFGTGNNVGAAGDMSRRTLFCNMDAMMERPEMRAFAANPVEIVKAARGDHVGAAYTIIRGYLAADTPGLKPLASYDTWCRFVRGPLMWLGEADPVKSMEEVRNEDPELLDIREFFESGVMAFDTNYKTQQIIDMATDDDTKALLARVSESSGPVAESYKLGMWLRKISGRIVAGMRIVPASMDKTRPKWRLVKV
jgi:RepB DNA-primase from phage plasmid